MSTRGEQIIYRLFIKVALLINDVRESRITQARGEIDKWFQLEILDDGRLQALALELKGLGNDGPLEMHVRSVLVPDPSSTPQSSVSVFDWEGEKGTEVSPRAHSIELEEWCLSLDRSTTLDQDSASEDPYPGVYKQAIVLMRGLYALLRCVPAWQLYQNLAPDSGTKVEVFASLASGQDAIHEGILDLTRRISPEEPDPISFAFPAIMTPLGAITLRARYRPDVEFKLDAVQRLRSTEPDVEFKLDAVQRLRSTEFNTPVLGRVKGCQFKPRSRKSDSNTKQAGLAPVPRLSIRNFIPSWVFRSTASSRAPYLTMNSTDLPQSATVAPSFGSLHATTPNVLHDHQNNDYPTHVAIKALRISLDTDTITQKTKHLKHAARELHTWGKCTHPNVLQLHGLAVFRGRIGMISPWMEKGNLPRYLEQTPDVDRCNLCIQICDGLSYMHQIGIIHGDLKGANVLISDDGAPVLTDFGNSLYSEQSMKYTETTSSNPLTIRWSAAELITGLGERSEASDVYALAMVCGNVPLKLEVLAGTLPYDGRREHTIMYLVVIKQEPPERPRSIPTGRVDGDKLWNLLLSCWSSEPKSRPIAQEVKAIMRTIAQADLLPADIPLRGTQLTS
ncbi:unnamed protein product [Rhizoctonia solani]|uniref:Autophagy-related protein 13 n=1 Tax=Rhizoctonia solani TaxID=456999 RepID=A0A8H3H3R3_9AGAM|nr:unnamed protein product [Rhizoctonia solani]